MLKVQIGLLVFNILVLFCVGSGVINYMGNSELSSAFANGYLWATIVSAVAGFGSYFLMGKKGKK